MPACTFDYSDESPRHCVRERHTPAPLEDVLVSLPRYHRVADDLPKGMRSQSRENSDAEFSRMIQDLQAQQYDYRLRSLKYHFH
jgi:hypothetical protein